MGFPGCEDYEEGCSPVADRALPDQIAYWKARARIAEELEYCLRQVAEAQGELAEPDAADWWKNG